MPHNPNLDHNDIQNNLEYAITLQSLYSFSEGVIQQLLDYAILYKITLNNLTESEENQLINILGGTPLDPNIFNHWANHLTHARAGVGQHIQLHQQQPLDITSCLERGLQPSRTWGSDRDFERIMQSYLTDPKSIQYPGTYLLPRVGLGEAETLRDYVLPLANTLAYCKLLIPIVKDNSHWELLKVSIKNHQVDEVILWDSVGNNNPNRPDCHTIARQLNHPVSIQATGIQSNNHSCMDHVTAESFRELGIKNPISTAINETSLRKAICQEIQHPAAKVLMTQDEVHQLLIRDQKLQLKFDAALAQALSDEYVKATDSDQDAITSAFQKTAIQFKFFKVAKPPVNKPMTEPQSEQLMIKSKL